MLPGYAIPAFPSHSTSKNSTASIALLSPECGMGCECRIRGGILANVLFPSTVHRGPTATLARLRRPARGGALTCDSRGGQEKNRAEWKKKEARLARHGSSMAMGRLRLGVVLSLGRADGPRPRVPSDAPVAADYCLHGLLKEIGKRRAALWRLTSALHVPEYSPVPARNDCSPSAGPSWPP